jgi:hypothetical protein
MPAAAGKAPFGVAESTNHRQMGRRFEFTHGCADRSPARNEMDYFGHDLRVGAAQGTAARFLDIDDRCAALQRCLCFFSTADAD